METEHHGNPSDAANAHFNEGDIIIDKEEKKIQTSPEASEFDQKKINEYYDQIFKCMKRLHYLGECQEEAMRTWRKSSVLEELGESRPSSPETKRRKIDKDEMKSPTYTLIQSVEEYQAAVNDNVHVVCHFYDDDDLECEVLDLFSSKLAEQHPETLFLRIHAGKNPDLVPKIMISKTPAVAHVKNGKMIGRKLGPDMETLFANCDQERLRIFIGDMCKTFLRD